MSFGALSTARAAAIKSAFGMQPKPRMTKGCVNCTAGHFARLSLRSKRVMGSESTGMYMVVLCCIFRTSLQQGVGKQCTRRCLHAGRIAALWVLMCRLPRTHEAKSSSKGLKLLKRFKMPQGPKAIQTRHQPWQGNWKALQLVSLQHFLQSASA